MSRPARRLGFAAIVSLALTGAAPSEWGARAAAPQEPTQRPPVFRAGANFVLVDAYPRRDGRVVPDLGAGDFEVLEDGKPQKIESVEFIRVPLNAADAERRDPRSKEAGDEAATDPRRRVFVLYFDTYFTSPEDAKGLRTPLDSFLSRAMGPLDLFGVLTPSIPVDALVLGQRPESVDAMLETYWGWARGNTYRETEPEQFIDLCFSGRTEYPGVNRMIVEKLIHLWQMDQLFSGLERLIARLGDLRDERKNVLLFSDGWDPGGPVRDLLKYLWGDGPPRAGVGPTGRLGVVQRNPTGEDHARCDQEMMRLTSIDFSRRYRDLPVAAVHANVAFYPVSRWGSAGRGMAIFDSSPSGLLRQLAADTGGTSVIEMTDVETGAALRRIADDLSAFYLLGYYSTNTSFDGRFRKIDVRMKVPQVTVTARKGYTAPTEASTRAVAAPRDAPAGPSAVDRALMSLAKLQSAAELAGYGVARPGPAGDLAIVAELTSTEVGGARWANGADVQAVVTGPSGETVATGRGRIEAGARSTLVRAPLAAAGAGPWRVTLRATSEAGEVRATAEVPMPEAGPVSGPLVSRASGGQRAALRPVAEFLFQRSERLHAEWIITQPLDERQARLLDRTGAPLPIEVPLTETIDGARAVLSADLALAPLAPGDYVLELVAGHGGATVRQLFALRVIR